MQKHGAFCYSSGHFLSAFFVIKIKEKGHKA